MITGIGIENFKGIRERVELELRPITLLFGANSAGKSTFLHALHYAREIFERRNFDADVTLAGGPQAELGGFQKFVHGHDLNRRIRLSLRLDVAHEFYPGFRIPLPSGVPSEPLESLVASVETAEVAVEIAWSQLHDAPYAARYEVTINGQSLGSLSHEPGRKEVRLYLDLDHPVFVPATEIEALAIELEEEESGSPESGLRRIWNGLADAQVIAELDEKGISLASGGDALPPFDQRLQLDADYDRLNNNLEVAKAQIDIDWIEEAISDVMLGPGIVMRDLLITSRYLGPLREKPERNFKPPRFVDPGRWASGLGAWDTLYQGSDKLVAKVASWLEDAEKLDAGYRVERRSYKEIALADPLFKKLLDGTAFDEVDEGARLDLESLPTQTRVVVVSRDHDIELPVNDVGTGISQVIPVVVTAVDGKHRLLAIEQPELHLHPKLQAELSDLFVEAALGDSKHMVILETHSELIPLRLMRRIRECHSDQSDGGMQRVTSEDVAIVYIETHDGATITTHLELGSDGGLLDPWPDGFFEEGFRERFSGGE